MAKQHYSESPSEKDKKAFSKYLAEDEELVLATGLGKTYMKSHFILGLVWPGIIFILLGLLVAFLMKINLGYGYMLGLGLAGVIAYFKSMITYHANRYLLTTSRVIIKRGFFAVTVTSALYDKITHIEVEQPFFDKILYHHGTIIVNTAGTNKGEITMKYVDYPIEFKNLLERLINRERSQIGLRGGSVTTVEGELVN